MAEFGTKVERMTPDSMKKSTAPDRTWPSTSDWEPSWSAGNTCRSKRPLVSALMRSAASVRRRCSGCVAGVVCAMR
ncbi:hypothetical protein D3C85_1629190 [compost metagenome]